MKSAGICVVDPYKQEDAWFVCLTIKIDGAIGTLYWASVMEDKKSAVKFGRKCAKQLRLKVVGKLK